MTVAYIQELQNNSIRYATERPAGSPFVSLGREIRILAPAADLKALAKSQTGFVPALIGCFDTPDKDWAANVVLYALTERDAMLLTAFEDDIDKWRKTQKDKDRAYWVSWWSTNRGRVL